MKICGVSFKDNGKIYNFDLNNNKLDIQDYVIVETEKGEQFGKVVKIFDSDERSENFKNLKQVIRKSTDQDYKKYLKTLKDGKDVLNFARTTAEELNLDMTFVDASYTFDRKQLIINFIADERVDFRELVKILAAKYKARIDLHQMGVRDKAKEISGLGPCGRALCCASFMSHMDAITINMAKNQNIALNPNKINGACGRLLCCLSYEDDVYTEYRKNLPAVGSNIKYEGKNAKVVSIEILNQKYTIDVDGDIKEIDINEK